MIVQQGVKAVGLPGGREGGYREGGEERGGEERGEEFTIVHTRLAIMHAGVLKCPPYLIMSWELSNIKASTGN